MKNVERFDKLFKELVPGYGKADSLAGEILRATGRIGHRFFNDGDRIGRGYGRETCNPAARFLLGNTTNEICYMVDEMWFFSENDDHYEGMLDILVEKVVDYIEAHPELREMPTEDMFSYRNKFEDVDDEEEEEEDYEDDDYEDDYED